MEGEEVISAFAAENGRIVAIDSNPADGKTVEVDLGGKTVIPAFHDSHQHFLCYATDKEKINFSTQSLLTI